MSTVGVLALQGDVHQHLAALEACGVRAVPVRRPAELSAVDALVLPGGESTTMSRLLETFELLEPVRARIAGGMPAYGSCAGMILLAREVLDGRPDQRQLGGLDVVVRRNAFGRQVDSFEADLDVAGVADGPLRAVFIRAPWVESAGNQVEVLATVPRPPGAESAAGRIVAVRQGMVLATAFHPELTGDGRVHRLFCDMVLGGVRPHRAAGWSPTCDGAEGVMMSGHSKWATTKHKKAAIDAKRGKIFAKLIKNIEVAARNGGGDPTGNPTLYDAIQKAKKSSVPNDNIDRAVKRGSGADGGGADYQSITYEGYGPNGVAVLVECLSDNRNRAASEVRTAMTRNGAQMADPGSVAYLFNRKGVVIVPKPEGAKGTVGSLAEDDVLIAVLDAGAEEVNDLGESFEVVSEAGDLVAVRTALQDAGIDYDSADLTFLPSVSVPLDADGARKVFKLIDALEDSDEVQNVYANFDVSDDVLAEVG